MKLAVIPARGGSKRIPRKNIRPFLGKPIIAYSIEAAIESRCFDKVIVSTDDVEIAEVARRFGADVPFTRPEHLSDDHAGTTAVVGHAIEWCFEAGEKVESVCCLYATAPFITPKLIQDGYRMLVDGDAEFVFSVAKFPFPIQRALHREESGFLAPVNPETFLMRSQDLDETFHDAGQFYWGLPESFLCGNPLLEKKSAGVILPRHFVQDIDTLEDWRHAELLYQTARVEVE